MFYIFISDCSVILLDMHWYFRVFIFYLKNIDVFAAWYRIHFLSQMFLEKLLVTLRNLFRRDFYPSDWLVMKMVTNRWVSSQITWSHIMANSRILDCLNCSFMQYLHIALHIAAMLIQPFVRTSSEGIFESFFGIH